MHESVGVLLRSVVDYAGTFPPAKLDLDEAMTNYAAASTGPHAAILGRFVLPASRLDEFARLAPAFSSPDQPPWPLSVLVTGDAAELDQVWSFRSRRRGKDGIHALEFAPLPSDQIEAIASRMPDGPGSIDVFFECRVDATLDAAIASIARRGALAKVRTGGTSANAFPAATDLVRFMRVCGDAGVGFKATAGLHHALSGRYALTYEADSPVGDMYGFLNVCVAAALIRARASAEQILAALRESSAQAFTFTNAGLEWRDRTIRVEALAETRRSFFRSFGSCAFGEPIEELKQLRII